MDRRLCRLCALVSYFLPHITSMVYYASPENNWAVSVLPQVPDWVIPLHDFDVAKDFYEGREDGAVPWDLWLPALFNWAPLLMSLYVAMISIVVILRKQWVDHERLVYPMMQLPISMIQDDEHGLPALIKPLFRNFLLAGIYLLLGRRPDHPGDGDGGQRTQGRRGIGKAPATAVVQEHYHRPCRVAQLFHLRQAGRGLRARGPVNTAHTFGEQGFYQWEDAAMRLGTMTDVNWGYWAMPDSAPR